MRVRNRPDDDPVRRLLRSGPLSKYDLVLAAVPALLSAGALGGRALPVPTPTAAGVGSALAALVVAYALFVSPPVEDRRSR